MHILIFTVTPLPLLNCLSDYLGRAGHEVIVLTGKQGRLLPGSRRIIINFAGLSTKTEDPAEIWKEAIKNGAFGRRALKNLACSWQPDLILLRSGQGAAFFVRNVFPHTFMAAFAADHEGHSIDLELDGRLFLESQLAFASSRSEIKCFPPLLRKAIKLEPLIVDTAFFGSGTTEPFRCWKIDSEKNRLVVLVLRGLPNAELADWSGIMATALAECPELGLVVLMEKAEAAKELLAALGSLPGRLADRLFITSRFERAAWRNLCRASAAVIFTNSGQRQLALECAASGRMAWATKKAGLGQLPGVGLLPGGEQLVEYLINPGPAVVGPEALAQIDAEYGVAQSLPAFAGKILAEYKNYSGC